MEESSQVCTCIYGGRRLMADNNRVKISFERSKVNEFRSAKNINPIREIEKYAKGFGATLLKSESTMVLVRVSSDTTDSFITGVTGFVTNLFGVNTTEGLMFITTEEDEHEENESRTEALAEQPRAERTPEEGAVASTAADHSKITIPDIIEEYDEGEENDDINTILSDICSNPPIRYSPAMKDYLYELNSAIRGLMSMNAEEILWQQNLLIPINRGFGLTAFIRSICKIYMYYNLVEEQKKKGNDRDKENESEQKAIDYDAMFEEMVIHKVKGEEDDAWAAACEKAESFSRANRTERRKIILCFDISEWVDELNVDLVRDSLRIIEKFATSYMCIFRTPYMEEQVLNRIQDQLGEVMAVRRVDVPPIPISNMVDYVKSRTVKYHFSTDNDVDSSIEQWIMRKKKNDYFYGYKALNNMVGEFLYDKALENDRKGNADSKIHTADFDNYLDERSTEDPYEILGNMIGLEQVKKKIREIVAQIRVSKELREKNGEANVPCIHMMFTGSPGTGKTTVARLVAKIFKEEGILSKGLFYEIKGRDLCGRYIGDTAPKTAAYCRDAYGSVLFIDEAYSLYVEDSPKDYGHEAIATLLTEMENHRKDFCIIMAGYTDEMHNMIKSNPGFESRVPYEIEFPNYTKEELEDIFWSNMGEGEHDKAVEDAVRKFVNSIAEETLKSKTFSNGRLIRNLYERAWGKAAYRYYTGEDKEVVIRAEDIVTSTEENDFAKMVKGEKEGVGPIGFLS